MIIYERKKLLTDFKEKFEEIAKAIDEATFLAFDTEFTGMVFLLAVKSYVTNHYNLT